MSSSLTFGGHELQMQASRRSRRPGLSQLPEDVVGHIILRAPDSSTAKAVSQACGSLSHTLSAPFLLAAWLLRHRPATALLQACSSGNTILAAHVIMQLSVSPPACEQADQCLPKLSLRCDDLAEEESLCRAAAGGHEKLVQLLLAWGVPASGSYNSGRPLAAAMTTGQSGAALCLLLGQPLVPWQTLVGPWVSIPQAARADPTPTGASSMPSSATPNRAPRLKSVMTVPAGAKGSVSKVNGGPSKVNGSLSKADGSPSKVDGGRSKVNGSLSKADGSPSKADGGRSKVDGSFCKVDGSLSKVSPPSPPTPCPATPATVQGDRRRGREWAGRGRGETGGPPTDTGVPLMHRSTDAGQSVTCGQHGLHGLHGLHGTVCQPGTGKPRPHGGSQADAGAGVPAPCTPTHGPHGVLTTTAETAHPTSAQQEQHQHSTASSSWVRGMDAKSQLEVGVQQIAGVQVSPEVVAGPVNAADVGAGDGRALTVAARAGDASFVRLLLCAGAIPCRETVSAAGAEGHLLVLQVLWAALRRPVGLECVQQAMLGASVAGHLHIIQWLWQVARDQVRAIAGVTLVAAAGHVGTEERLAVLAQLLEWGANVHTAGDAALCRAVAANSGTVVQFLVAAGADVNAQEGLPLRTACEQGTIEVARTLIAAGAVLPGDGAGLLRVASAVNNLEMLRLLLHTGADAHAGEEGALRTAASSGALECVRELLAPPWCCDCRANEDEALLWACDNGHEEVVKVLLAAGADASGETGGHLLWSCIGKEYRGVVAVLLAAGATFC